MIGVVVVVIIVVFVVTIAIIIIIIVAVVNIINVLIESHYKFQTAQIIVNITITTTVADQRHQTRAKLTV